MNRRKRLVIPVLLGLFCMCVMPATSYAADDDNQRIELTLEVPEKPESEIKTPADAESLKDVKLPKDWKWKDESMQVQPGRTITAIAIYKSGYEMDIEVTGTLVILAEGTDTSYVIGKDSSASIHCNGVLGALVNVEMDGKEVSASNYDTKDGSTIVTFKKSYIDTLSVGKHTVTLNYEAGSVDSMITVSRAESSTTPNTAPSNSTTTGSSETASGGEQTGDMTNLVGVLGMLILSGMIVLVLLRKKRAEN